MMRTTAVVTLLLVVFLEGIICPPVTPSKPTEAPAEAEQEREDQKFGLEYERYLKEVVGILESDDTFRKKLEESNVSEIKSGEIARHLEFVNHGIRSKLDELKRKEIDRLRQAMKMQAQLERGIKFPHALPINPAGIVQGFKQMGRDLNLPQINRDRVLAHLDHKNPNTFEVEDLAKLIKQATQDLEDLDQKRRTEFKEYEMEKERERQEELKKLDEEKRQEEMRKFEEMKKKHADHPKLHHPGNKDQLEEVWEETDGMDKEDFDPKTFFYMHDTNGDGLLDEGEVEALFQNELDKVYDRDNPEDDLVERDEEMNRMREHVFNEVDTDGNKLISLKEFMISTNGEDFEKDEGWDTLDEQKIYSDDELEQYVKEYEERQRQAYEQQGHKVPIDPSQHPPIPQDNLQFQGRGGQDHFQGQGQPPAGGVQHMEQQQQQQQQQQQFEQGQGQPLHQGQGQPVPQEQDQQRGEVPKDAPQVHVQDPLPQHPRVPTNQ